jgi:hypothetical protein
LLRSRLGLPRAGSRASLLVLGVGLAQIGVVEARAGEVGLLARHFAVAFLELLSHEVEHEHRVDDPDPGGEVRASLVDVGVAAVASAVAGLAGDPDLQRPRLRAGGKSVELAVEPSGLAAEDARELLAPGLGELLACPLDLLGTVEERAVIDPDGVGVLVLDDRAVDERPHVLERVVVEVVGRDPFRDGLGELWCDLMHVGEAVGHRDR